MTIDDPSGDGTPDRGTGERARPTAHELKRYEALFAQRTHGMRSSAMRDMMSLTERPEVISLAGGLPETRTFPPELYAKLMAKVAAESTARALQYGPTEGMACTVECIVEVMAAENTSVDPDEVLVTTGGQQVIDLMCKALIDPGDTIVAEAPTYPGAVPTFDAYQANVVQIEMDSDGMPIDELEATLDRLRAEGRSAKFIYTIPNFQNPAGVTMSLARRRRLVEVAREREVLVLEDNPYGLLRYEGEPLPTLHSLDALAAKRGGASDFVVYLGTFSKILSPGVRLGWAVAPRPVLEKLNLCKQGADLCSSPVTQLFVAAYFQERAWGGSRGAGGGRSTASGGALGAAGGGDRGTAGGGGRGAAGGGLGDEPLWLAHLGSLKEPLPRSPRRDAGGPRRALRGGRELDQATRRAVHLGDAPRLHRHQRPACTGARERGGRVRTRARRLPRRPRGVLDAPQFRRGAGGSDPRGDPPDRQGGTRAGGPVWHAHRSGASPCRRTSTAARSRVGAGCGATHARGSQHRAPQSLTLDV